MILTYKFCLHKDWYYLLYYWQKTIVHAVRVIFCEISVNTKEIDVFFAVAMSLSVAEDSEQRVKKTSTDEQDTKQGKNFIFYISHHLLINLSATDVSQPFQLTYSLNSLSLFTPLQSGLINRPTLKLRNYKKFTASNLFHWHCIRKGAHGVHPVSSTNARFHTSFFVCFCVKRIVITCYILYAPRYQSTDNVTTTNYIVKVWFLQEVKIIVKNSCQSLLCKVCFGVVKTKSNKQKFLVDVFCIFLCIHFLLWLPNVLADFNSKRFLKHRVFSAIS